VLPIHEIVKDLLLGPGSRQEVNRVDMKRVPIRLRLRDQRGESGLEREELDRSSEELDAGRLVHLHLQGHLLGRRIRRQHSIGAAAGHGVIARGGGKVDAGDLVEITLGGRYLRQDQRALDGLLDGDAVAVLALVPDEAPLLKLVGDPLSNGRRGEEYRGRRAELRRFDSRPPFGTSLSMIL